MSRRHLPWAVAALYLLFPFPTPEFPPYNADDGSWFVTMHRYYTATLIPIRTMSSCPLAAIFFPSQG